ncbi:unnamed protein product [Prunus armeniaca]
MSEGDHVWSTDMLEVSSRWIGEVGDGPLVPLTYCDENDIHKKLDLSPNTINVHQALNILARFCGLRWLLSEHQKEANGLPPAEDVERWELHGSELDDLPVEREKSSTKLPHSSTSKSSVRGSRLLGMSLWELLLHLLGSSASSAQTVRRSMACRRFGIFCSEITTCLQSHEQSSTELTQCCEFQPRELKSRPLEQRVLKFCELPIQKLVIAPLVKFDTYVEATEASKHEIVANAYKLGYSDCRNSASPCCPLEHEDGKQLYLDLHPAQSEQSNVVDAEAVEEQIADEAVMEEDNSQGGVADKVRPYAKENAGEAVE